MIFVLFLLMLTGGPCGFGYHYIDSREPGGPVFDWIDVTSGTHIPLGDDANSGLIDIVPGSFWFYGTEYSRLAICSNGWVSFTSTANFYPTQSIPQPPAFVNILAPFAGDLRPGRIYWDTIGTKLVIGWESMTPLVSGGITYTFQVILDSADSSITFQYLKHEGAGNPWTLWFFLTGIGGTVDGLEYPHSAREDSLAIRFYYAHATAPDVLPLSIDYPGDGFLILPDEPCSIRVRIMNPGGHNAENVVVHCIVDSMGRRVFSDSQTIDILANSVSSLTFSGWVPRAFVDYRISVITGRGDPEPDTLSIRVKAPGSVDDSLYYDSGRIASGFSPGSDSLIALMFSLNSTPVLLKYIRLWLISEGDGLHPYPDATIDPVIIYIWEGQEGPVEMIWMDTLWRDAIPPGWVYSVPEGSLSISTENFWIAMGTGLSGYGREAVAMDESSEYPERKWIYGKDGWVQVDFGTGDPLISAFIGGPLVGISETEERPTFFLGRISPNPIAGPFSVSFGIEKQSMVEIKVYDLSGRKVRDILGQDMSPGTYSMFWDLMDNRGIRVSSGVYFLRISSGKQVINQKFVLF